MLADLARASDRPVYVAGVDEVGRGAIAGPASVGIAVVGLETTNDFPLGLRDSKLLSASARERMVEPVKRWVVDSAVGHSSIEDVNSVGIVGALRSAARQAYNQLRVQPDIILLDGKHDWWSGDGLFTVGPDLPQLPVRMEIKGDARCAVVACASVLAKVERDALMVRAASEYPGYGWEKNKGYASAQHIAGLKELGVSPFHRTSWKLPGVEG